MIDGSPTEFWSSDERRILTLAQDVVHCATEARANMHKHVALGIAVRHTKRSKQLITMFSGMGPCSSYDDIEAMDTSTANEIIANLSEKGSVLWLGLSSYRQEECLHFCHSDIIGVVLPSNISTCVFEQVAADNNDNMKTLLTVTGQPTPQHWSFFLKEIDGSSIEFSTVYTFRKNVHYTMALLGQNSVGLPSIMGQYPMFVRTGTHERTTALKPLHPGMFVQLCTVLPICMAPLMLYCIL